MQRNEYPNIQQQTMQQQNMQQQNMQQQNMQQQTMQHNMQRNDYPNMQRNDYPNMDQNMEQNMQQNLQQNMQRDEHSYDSESSRDIEHEEEQGFPIMANNNNSGEATGYNNHARAQEHSGEMSGYVDHARTQEHSGEMSGYVDQARTQENSGEMSGYNNHAQTQEIPGEATGYDNHAQTQENSGEVSGYDNHARTQEHSGEVSGYDNHAQTQEIPGEATGYDSDRRNGGHPREEPEAVKKAGVKRGQVINNNKTLEDWFIACERYEQCDRNIKEGSTKMKNGGDHRLSFAEFLRCDILSGSKFADTKAMRVSLGKYLKRYRSGTLVRSKHKRQRTRKFDRIEIKLCEYLDGRAKDYRKNRCGLTWVQMRDLCLKWRAEEIVASEEGVAIAPFECSDGWLSDVLKRHDDELIAAEREEEKGEGEGFPPLPPAPVKEEEVEQPDSAEEEDGVSDSAALAALAVLQEYCKEKGAPADFKAAVDSVDRKLRMMQNEQFRENYYLPRK